MFPWGASSLEQVRDIRAQAVQTLCQRGPEALLDGFANAVHRHQEVLENIEQADVAKMARYPRGLVPVGEWIGMQLIELLVHDWDMRKPRDDLAQLAAFAVEPVLTLLPETQLRFVSHRLADAGTFDLKDGGYRICAGASAWTFRVRDRAASYEATPQDSPTTSFYADAEALILLTLGRVDAASQLAAGTCRFEGHPEIDTSLYDLIFSPYLSASVIPPQQP